MISAPPSDLPQNGHFQSLNNHIGDTVKQSEKKATAYITPEVTACFVNVFEPRADLNGNEKYSVALVFDPDADLSELKVAILNAAENHWGDKAAGMLRDGTIRNPLNQQAEKYAKGTAGFNDSGVYLNAKSNNQPGIVDAQVKPILDRNKVYSGCRIRADINFFPYWEKGTGVGVGLNNIQLVGPGERLSGGRSAESAFTPVAGAAAAADDGDANPDNLF